MAIKVKINKKIKEILESFSNKPPKEGSNIVRTSRAPTRRRSTATRTRRRMPTSGTGGY